MELSTLPNELQLSICELLDPISSFHLAITSKAHWNLFTPVIQNHARLFAENKSFKTSSTEHFVWDKYLSHTKCYGLYVRDLSVRNDRYWDSEVWAHFQLGSQSSRPPPEVYEPLVAAAHDIKLLYKQALEGTDSLWPNLESAIQDGSPEPVVALLVHHLPYLKSFRYTDGASGDPFSIFDLVDAVVRAYASPVRAPHLPFQHLTTVMIAHWDTEFAVSAEVCLMFLAIPSVRTFVGWQMGGECDRDFAGSSKSRAKELLFENSQFHPASLDRILMNIEALERFGYESGGAIVSYDDFMPKKVIKSLSDHAAHSLENLILNNSWEDDVGDDDDEDGKERMSLRGFKTLKTFQCNWSMLEPDLDDLDSDVDEELSGRGFYTEDTESVTVFDPRSILPESLEALHLKGPFTDEEWLTLTQLLEESSDFTPNLKTIRLSKSGPNGPTHWTSPEADEESDVAYPAWRKSLSALIQGHRN
ncbi:hypothetical protein K491DRAFT_459535 [Lophiostoma macrostomum CBS 122681]|uniref:F-box domain-containing protein n=1 Tax=Lophiostoma macrostomum CBS 122681 TaxID=1314788 RepID=A0A6A6T4M2_9PLEO|nr:hypothetical protein K491DRAFT_459535 [Lophiostoma macrostomum CBS 122681]